MERRLVNLAIIQWWQTYHIQTMRKLEAFKSSFVTNMKDRIAVCYKWTDLIDIYDQNGPIEETDSWTLNIRYAHFKEFRNGNAIAATSDKEII